MAGLVLWHLISGRMPIGQAKRYRRDSPALYWFQILVLTVFFALAIILFHLEDRRAPIMFFAGILICNIPGLLRETLPGLAKGNVPDSDDRVGRFFIRIALILGTVAALALVFWVLFDIARSPPW